MRKISLVSLSLVLLFIFSACDREQARNPVMNEASVTSKGKVIRSVEKLLETNTGSDEDRTLFQSLMAESDLIIPYVKLGEIIQVDFSGTAPDSYKLTDYILKEDGTFKYNKGTASPVNLEFDNKKATFKLDSIMTVFLSSDSKDYEPGATFRGFRLIGEWVDQSKEITFIVRTDTK